MPKFPVYERGQGLGGGATASYASEGAFTAPARALAGMGAALADVGSDISAQVDKFRETQDSSWFSKARAESAIEMVNAEREAQQSATGEAQDYTPTIRGRFDTVRQRRLAEAPSPRAKQMYQTWADGYDVDLTERASRFQAQSTIAKRATDFSDAMNAHAQTIYSDPDQFDAVYKRAMDDFEGAKAWMTPEQEAQARAKVEHDLKLARAKTLVQFRPEQFRQETGRNVRVPAVKAAPDVQSRGQQAMSFFTGKGYTKEQAAGIVGNLIGESNLRTGARNPGDGRDGSDSIGIGQWNGERANRLKRFAASQGRDWQDFGVQLAFVDVELQNHEIDAYRALKQARTVDEATAAFIGYERPAGWSRANPRGGHNYKGRLAHAASMAGVDVEEYREGGNFADNPYYAGLSVDEIQTLASRAEANQAASETASYASYRDSFALSMAQGDILTADQILSSQLDAGDKAQFLNQFNSARKDEMRIADALSRFSEGALDVDAYDTDARKTVDGMFGVISKTADADQQRAVSEEIVSQTGIVPKQVLNELRRGIESTNAQEVAAAAQRAARIGKIDPAALGRRDGGQAVADAATAFDHYVDTVGLDPETAAKRMIDARDPEKQKARAALMDSKPIKDFVKDHAVENTVRDIFDPGVLGFDPELGDTPAQGAAMVGEYRSILEESIFDAAGDTELGSVLAAQRFARRYGPSAFSLSGPSTVIRLPPEKAYPPASDGTHAYIGEQLAEAMKAEGIEAEEYYLQPYEATDEDFRAGRPVRYQVWYKIGDRIETFNLPFFAIPPSQTGKPDLSENVRRMQQNRDDVVRGRDRERNLDQFLDGNPLTGEN